MLNLALSHLWVVQIQIVMNLSAEVLIHASREEIWKVITDIEHADERISGIEKVEVHHNPGESLVGFKWTETRTLFGKTATETMWITNMERFHFYEVQAESHGAKYTSVLRIIETDEELVLRMDFNSVAQTFGAKIMALVFGSIFKRATQKALQQDLLDIKKFVEAKNN